MQILGPVGVPIRLRDQVFVKRTVFSRVFQIQRAGLDGIGDPDIQQCLVQRDTELAIRGGQCRALLSGQKIDRRALIDVAILLLVMLQRSPQCRQAAVWRELHLAHDIGNAVLQFEGVRLQQGEIVLALLKFRHIFLEFINLHFDTCRGIFRIHDGINQGDLLAVAQLCISYDMPDRG